jgi:Tol biopolymer transport system component
MLADLRAGTIRPLLDRPGLYSRPAWSPDGSYLAYTESNGRLQILRLSDDLVQVLSDDAYVSKVIDLRGDTVDVVPVAPRWVDGTHIAYPRSDGSGRMVGLAKLALDGSERSMLVEDLVNPYDGFAFTPNGSRLAYARSDEGETPLVLVDLRSGERLEIEENSSNQVRSPASRLQWSPDGTYLVGGAGSAGIFLMEGDPPAYRVSQIKAFGVLGEAQSWAPDSRRFVILVEKGNNQLPGLAIYDLEHTTLSELAIELRPPYTVAWNPK